MTLFVTNIFEYYSLTVLQKILNTSGLKIINVDMNSINGESFAVTAVKRENRSFAQNRAVIAFGLSNRKRTMGLYTPWPYRQLQKIVCFGTARICAA